MSWASARGLGRRCKKSLAPLAQGRRPAAAVGQLVVKLREYFRQLRHQLVAMHVAPLLATFSLVAEGSCSCGEACGGGDRFEHFCGYTANFVQQISPAMRPDYPYLNKFAEQVFRWLRA